MRIYAKRTRKNRLKQFIQKLTIQILCLVAVLYLLNSGIEYLKTVSLTKNVYIKNDVADVVSAVSDDVPVVEAEEILSPKQEIIKENSLGVDWKILWGMFIKESQGDCNQVSHYDYVFKGVEYPSVGCYQINRYWTPESVVSDECAKDLACSTKWTAERLLNTKKLAGALIMQFVAIMVVLIILKRLNISLT